MIGEGAVQGSDASLLLADLFSRAQIQLTVPRYRPSSQGWTSTSSAARDIAFYDEVLPAAIKLQLPKAPSILPPPQAGHAAYALPLALDEDDDAILEERTEQARSTRLVLLAFLDNLTVEIRGSYTSPRPPLPPGSAAVPPTIAATPTSAAGGVSVPLSHRPVPSVSELRDLPYQKPEVGSGGSSSNDVSFCSVTWHGNQIAPINSHDVVKHGAKSASSHAPVDQSQSAGATSNLLYWDQASERWTVDWQPDVSITYSHHSHPHPSLLLTALLSLRLSPTSALLSALSANLAGGSPFGVLTMTQQPLSSWAEHDLLASLSSGPVYPDESPSQRAARAASALAKLPLSRLPSKVLGTNLVTPERSARNLGKKVALRQSIAMPSAQTASPSHSGNQSAQEDADLTELGDAARLAGTSSTFGRSENGRSDSFRSSAVSEDDSHIFGRSRDLSENGLLSPAAGDRSRSSSTASSDHKGDSVVTLQRSILTALDVRSAIVVRMRTSALDTSSGPLHASRKALVLCVEVENPSESGHLFDISNVQIVISTPEARAGAATAISAQVKATLAEPEGERDSGTAFTLAQGEQRNLVFFVRFEMDPGHGLADIAAWCTAADAATSVRNVAIVVSGRPILLRSDTAVASSEDVEAHDSSNRVLSANFSSTWNCTLDMKALQEDLRRRMFSQHGPLTMAASTAASGLSIPQSNAVAGNAKYAPSSLAAAAARDHEREQENMVRLEAHRVSNPAAMARSSSGLSATSTSLAGRFLSTQSRYAMSASSSEPSGLTMVSANSEPQATPAPRPHGAVHPDHGATRSPSAVGFLAQAKLRAASARLSSLSLEADTQLGPGNVLDNHLGESRDMTPQRLVSSPLVSPRDRVRRSASIMSSMSGATMRGASSHLPTQPIAVSEESTAMMVPLRRAPPFGAHASEYSAPGYFVTTRIRLPQLGSGNTEPEGSNKDMADLAPLAASQIDLQRFNIEISVVNYSGVARSFMVGWAGSSPESSTARHNGVAAAHAQPSQHPDSRAPVNPASVLDATHAMRQYLESSTPATRSCSRFLPLESSVKLGPVESGQSASCMIPMQSLVPLASETDASATGESADDSGKYRQQITGGTLPLGDLILQEVLPSLADSMTTRLGQARVLAGAAGSIYVGAS
ncbi:unnamed protein product [Parajaminaea phylloscopi]